MHNTLFAFGSWGDVRPLVVLGMGLKSAGHEVQMAASPSYEDWVRARSLDFYPLTDDGGRLPNPAGAITRVRGRTWTFFSISKFRRSRG